MSWRVDRYDSATMSWRQFFANELNLLMSDNWKVKYVPTLMGQLALPQETPYTSITHILHTLYMIHSDRNGGLAANQFDMRFRTGKFYWDVHITSSYRLNLYIQLIHDDRKTRSLRVHDMYAYNARSGCYSAKTEARLYGIACKQKDVLGVLFDSDQLKLGFFVNDLFLGMINVRQDMSDDEIEKYCVHRSVAFYPMVCLTDANDSVSFNSIGGLNKSAFIKQALK
jgi:hypothetical protein